MLCLRAIRSSSSKSHIKNAITKNLAPILGFPLSDNKNNLLQQKCNYSSNRKYLSTSVPKLQQEEVQITFVRANGERIKAKGKIGDSLLDVVVNNNIDLEGFGACEGTLTCSTCHLIFAQPDYDKLPEKASDEELDMLDLAYDLTDTSRLGCQIILSKDLEGLEIKVPTTINDARS